MVLGRLRGFICDEAIASSGGGWWWMVRYVRDWTRVWVDLARKTGGWRRPGSCCWTRRRGRGCAVEEEKMRGVDVFLSGEEEDGGKGRGRGARV